MLNLLLHTPLSALILGPLVTRLVDSLKRGWSWLDAQGPSVKQGAAVAVSFVLVLMARVVTPPAACSDTLAQGISDACATALLNPAWLQGLLVALVAIAVKHGKQQAKQ